MKYTTLMLAGLLALIMTTTTALSNKAKIDSKAPDFTLTDVNGNTHSLSDFEGKFVVLEWINFQCPFVVKHYKSGNMQKLQKKYTASNVVWLSICSSAPGKQGHLDNARIIELLNEHKAAPTAYLVDETGDVGRNYNAKTTPNMYIIDPDGMLIYAGAIDDIKSTDTDDVPIAKNYVAEALDAALDGKSVPTKVTDPYGCSVKY